MTPYVHVVFYLAMAQLNSETSVFVVSCPTQSNMFLELCPMFNSKIIAENSNFNLTQIILKFLRAEPCN